MTDPETGLTPGDMLDVIADAQSDVAALEQRLAAALARATAAEEREWKLRKVLAQVCHDYSTGSSSLARLRERIEGLAERWARERRETATGCWHDCGERHAREVRALLSEEEEER